ncbi:hypothetical protein LCGC14_0944420, partial [marine sediment metagenome]
MRITRRVANNKMGDVNEVLLKAILRKVHNSEPLNNEERNYQRKLFDDMMSSKKIVQKTVRILTGEEMRKEQSSELRKSKTDAEATRKDPRYTEGKNPSKIEGDKPSPDILRAKAKILDADLKPKEVKTEAERLSDKTQNPIMPRTEAVKFVSLNPVKAGDIVIKNFASSGQMLIKGVVLNVDEVHGTATVKWAHGRMSHEFSHTLVKAKATKQVDPKLGVPEKEEDEKNPPMKKQTTPRRKKPSIGQRAGQAVRQVGARVGRAYTAHKERRARSQAIAAPARHARRAVGPGTYFRAPSEGARAMGRAIRAVPAARQATRERRQLRGESKTGRAVRAVGRGIATAGRRAGRLAQEVARNPRAAATGVGRRAVHAAARRGLLGTGGAKNPVRLRVSMKPTSVSSTRRRRKMMKGKMTSQELEQSKRLAERLKGKKNIGNPHALARHMVQQKFTKVERIEIVNTIMQGTQIEKHNTPKKHPHGKRKGGSVAGEVVRGGIFGALAGSRAGRAAISHARRIATEAPRAARR